MTDVWPNDRSWEAGYLAAAFDGEGHLSQLHHAEHAGKHMVIVFVQRDNEMRREVSRCLEQLGFDVGSYAKDNGCGLYYLRGDRGERLRLLGQVRPRRLLAHFDADMAGMAVIKDNVPIIRSQFIGDQPVIGLKTSTGTFIAEGFASHNSGQRPSCEYFIGIAQGMGVKVYLPTESELLKTNFLYGFEVDAEQVFTAKLKDKRTDIENTINALDNQFLQLIEARAQNRGAHQLAQHLIKNWHPTGDEIERMQKAGVLK